MLCDEAGYLTQFFPTNKSNKVEGTVTKLRKSRYLERMTKYERFKYLLKQLDGSSLLDIVRQVVSQTMASDRERTLCVCVYVGVCAHVRVCVFELVCMYVCVHMCVFTCMYLCTFVCVCLRVFACVCVYARMHISLYASMRARMPVCLRLWTGMCACERVFFACVYVCTCVYKDRGIVEFTKIPTVPECSGLMQFRSRLLT